MEPPESNDSDLIQDLRREFNSRITAETSSREEALGRTRAEFALITALVKAIKASSPAAHARVAQGFREATQELLADDGGLSTIAAQAMTWRLSELGDELGLTAI